MKQHPCVAMQATVPVLWLMPVLQLLLLLFFTTVAISHWIYSWALLAPCLITGTQPLPSLPQVLSAAKCSNDGAVMIHIFDNVCIVCTRYHLFLVPCGIMGPELIKLCLSIHRVFVYGQSSFLCGSFPLHAGNLHAEVLQSALL